MFQPASARPEAKDRPNAVVSLSQIRELVTARLKAEHITIYALAKQLKGRVAQKSVYDFFNVSTTDIRYSTVVSILDVCDFDLSASAIYRGGYRLKAVWYKRSQQKSP